MKKKTCTSVFLVLLLMSGLVSAVAQSEIGPARLLLIDETKTFASTMRVAALAKTIREFEGAPLELTVRLADVGSSYEDPLGGHPIAEQAPFHVIIIIPRGIDDTSIHQIWLLTTLSSSPPTPEWEGVKLLGLLIDAVFDGIATAANPMQDLWPAMLATGYAAQGWLE